MNIVIYGAANDLIEKTFIEAGEEFGKQMAQKNYGLVFGGMSTGMMGAVARGISTNKNSTMLSIIPEALKIRDHEIIYKESTKIIYTKTLNERKQLLADSADAIVVMPGGIGTYDEFFEALDSKRMGYHEKPIIIYNINGYYNKLQEFIDFTIENKFAKPDCKDSYAILNTSDEIFAYIENYKKTNDK